jgi:Fe-S-cluster containining protein
MTCTGLCCKKFYLPVKYDELMKTEGSLNGSVEEREFIKDMVIWLEDYKKTSEEDTHEGAYYTCRYWDTETHLCKVYEKRPIMCKGFPYKRKCKYDENCTEVGEEIDELKTGGKK